jgi:hypothetical protein
MKYTCQGKEAPVEQTTGTNDRDGAGYENVWWVIPLANALSNTIRVFSPEGGI